MTGSVLMLAQSAAALGLTASGLSFVAAPAAVAAGSAAEMFAGFKDAGAGVVGVEAVAAGNAAWSDGAPELSCVWLVAGGREGMSGTGAESVFKGAAAGATISGAAVATSSVVVIGGAGSTLAVMGSTHSS